MTRARTVPIVILALLIASCASNPHLSPTGNAALKAHRVVQALGVLQDAAIAGNAMNPPLFSTRDTGLVVRFCVSSSEIAEKVPSGAAASIQAGLTALREQLPPETRTKLSAYLTLLDVVLLEVSR